MSRIRWDNFACDHPVTAMTFPMEYRPGMVRGIRGALALVWPVRFASLILAVLALVLITTDMIMFLRSATKQKTALGNAQN